MAKKMGALKKEVRFWERTRTSSEIQEHFSVIQQNNYIQGFQEFWMNLGANSNRLHALTIPQWA